MNRSVKQEEFDKFRRGVNVSIDVINKKLAVEKYKENETVSRGELISQVKLANAKFDAMEDAINLIFNILESHNLNITTCTHCNQPLPKADNEG
jgi:biotin synthase-related radical SAM superfamily protein